ncbi:MAG: hypothetical protein IPL16_06155 [Ignavibacteria bacterium]|nr:hypothetical protein [Ignavibacteria bacterium]
MQHGLLLRSLCSSNAMNYDFHFRLSQAYGSNQISVSGVPSFTAEM